MYVFIYLFIFTIAQISAKSIFDVSKKIYLQFFIFISNF